jgi:hypothetical protein
MASTKQQLSSRLADVTADAAAHHPDKPLDDYGLLALVFNAALGGTLLFAGRKRRLPERIEPYDLALFGVAAHKLARLVTKDRVTEVVRAPFTELVEEEEGGAEVVERPRGEGLRRAVGELVTCPYCVDLWASGGLIASSLFAPRATRVVAATFATNAISDFLQIAFVAGRSRA